MRKRGFRYKIYQSIVERTLRNNKRSIEFPEISLLKKVLVILDGDLLDSYQTELSLLKGICEVEVLKWVNQKRDKNPDNEALFLSDIGFWGTPKNVLVNHYIDEPYDVLINLTTVASSGIEYICTKSAAKFKVSGHANGQVYDLVLTQKNINGNGLISSFLETIKRFKRKH